MLSFAAAIFINDVRITRIRTPKVLVKYVGIKKYAYKVSLEID